MPGLSDGLYGLQEGLLGDVLGLGLVPAEGQDIAVDRLVLAEEGLLRQDGALSVVFHGFPCLSFCFLYS